MLFVLISAPMITDPVVLFVAVAPSMVTPFPLLPEIIARRRLPWGTADEEYIPESLKQAAEFELAREQLATQTPEIPEEPASATNRSPAIRESRAKGKAKVLTAAHQRSAVSAAQPELLPAPSANAARSLAHVPADSISETGLPVDWPDPRGFVPSPPSAVKPQAIAQAKPVMTHTRLYNGKDGEFTEKLGRYFYRLDDARFGGWQAYLQRPDDFVRFCCHLHVTETLAARGGAGRTDVIVRWPISR